MSTQKNPSSRPLAVADVLCVEEFGAVEVLDGTALGDDGPRRRPVAGGFVFRRPNVGAFFWCFALRSVLSLIRRGAAVRSWAAFWRLRRGGGRGFS
ncbi:hypothetical protein [Pyrobaculum sp.]|uniref:hypothetical protein n=1 Tax=Pyrobaculum sp. TaxID=2004705 RepID=UPI003168ABED